MIDQGFFIVLAAIGTVFLTIGGAYAGSYEFSVEWDKTTGWWDCFKLICWNPNASLFFGSASFLFGALGTFKDQSAQNKKMSALQDENVTLVDTRQALNTTQEQL
ncbi:hypothetical protein, partial [Vibrio parahaemolyticus]